MKLTKQDTLSAVLLLIGAVVLVAISTIIYLTPPASGFEFSIYKAYPLYFWGLIVLGLIIGQAVMVRHALLDDEGITPSWRLGLVIIIGIEAVVLLLPKFRGYVAYNRADVLTHVGFIRDIQQLGFVVPSDIYPNSHLLTLTLSYATGVEPLHIINTISVVIPLFSVLTWYALVSHLFDRRPALLTLPFATLLIGGSAYVNSSPYTQSTLLVPFVLYLFVMEQQKSSLALRLALAFTIVALVVYHPLTTVFMLVPLLIHIVVATAQNHGFLSSDLVEQRPVLSLKVTTQLAAGVFLSWYFQFTPILKRTESVIQEFSGAPSGGSQLNKYTSTVSQTSPQPIDILAIALADYGLTAVLIFLGGLYFVKVLYDLLTERLNTNALELTFLSTFTVFGVLSVMFLIFDMVVGFGRPLIFVRFFGVLLTGALFHHLYHRFGTRTMVTALLGVCLVSVAVFGVTDLYHSPMKAEANHQVTEAEIEGTEWWLTHRIRFTKPVEQGIALYRFSDVHYGKNKTGPEQTVDPNAPLPPDHFGYDRNATLGSSYDSDHYLAITERGREFYPEMYPDYRDDWGFYPREYDRLEKDSTVAQLYDNGEFSLYRIETSE